MNNTPHGKETGEARETAATLNTIEALRLAIRALNQAVNFNTGITDPGNAKRTLRSYDLIPLLDRALEGVWIGLGLSEAEAEGLSWALDYGLDEKLYVLRKTAHGYSFGELREQARLLKLAHAAEAKLLLAFEEVSR